MIFRCSLFPFCSYHPWVMMVWLKKGNPHFFSSADFNFPNYNFCFHFKLCAPYLLSV